MFSQLDCKWGRLDGTMPKDKRQRVIDAFNTGNDLFCLLLTTGVGGVGLNLTGADRVIVFDPSWNPMQDLQAIDRA